MEDLEPFFPERMASRILGMGDIATFLEKAQVKYDMTAFVVLLSLDFFHEKKLELLSILL